MDSLDMVSPYLFRYKGKNFPLNYDITADGLDFLKNFEIQDTDIFIITYPKSGTTWCQQILVQIIDTAHPDQVEDLTNRLRAPFLEYPNEHPDRQRPAPRLFCSHLPPNMLPPGVRTKRTKVVYVMRNPKDNLVSLYHFCSTWPKLETPASFEDFFKQYLDGKVYMGSWFDHIHEWHAARNQFDIFFLKYEDMIKDLKGEVVKICKFLEKDLTDEAVDHVVEKSIFKNMKVDSKANYRELKEAHLYRGPTMRNGTIGDWRNYFSVAQNELFDQVYRDRMKDLPLTFTWDISHQH